MKNFENKQEPLERLARRNLYKAVNAKDHCGSFTRNKKIEDALYHLYLLLPILCEQRFPNDYKNQGKSREESMREETEAMKKRASQIKVN